MDYFFLDSNKKVIDFINFLWYNEAIAKGLAGKQRKQVINYGLY